MAADSYVYDGSSWRNLSEWWVYDGSTWRDCSEVWVYDGSTWRKVFESASCIATLDSATQKIGSDGNGCSSGKCVRCVEWVVSNDTTEEIKVRRSVSGGSYFTVLDAASEERRCGTLDTCGDSGCVSGTIADGKGCFCDAGCNSDGTSTQFKVRLEELGTGNLACGDSGNEITTGSQSACGGAA